MRSPHTDGPQDLTSVEKNKTFFAENAKYAADVSEIATYRNVRRAIDESITGVSRLLDVGNGGVFDYDTSLVDEIVGVDLFLDEAAPPTLPSNVTLRRGNALALDEPDESYDAVLSVFVFHHLIAKDVSGTIDNIRCAIAESKRVLRPGGRFIIAESCVSPRAFSVEKRLFPLLRGFASTPLMKHPATLQLPPQMICEALEERFDLVHVAPVPIGRVILQFGRRWPTALTPARPYLFTARSQTVP